MLPENLSAHCIVWSENIALTEPLKKLGKDLKNAAATLTDREARYLVDLYYQMQNNRIRSANQVRIMSTTGEPHQVLAFFFDQAETIEKQIQNALGAYAKASPLGSWALDQKGIGKVLAAGLLAHIDINKAKTAGAIQRFAGLDPTLEWVGKDAAKKLVDEIVQGETPTEADVAVIESKLRLKPGTLKKRLAMLLKQAIEKAKEKEGIVDEESVEAELLQGDDEAEAAQDITWTKKNLANAISVRPWNAKLKVLCWKIGMQFVKVSGENQTDNLYGRLYRERHDLLTATNECGGLAQVAASLIGKYNKNTAAYKSLKKGMLPKAQIFARARRFAVKIFLSHYHQMGYRLLLGKESPAPYPIGHLGHLPSHKIEPGDTYKTWEERHMTDE